MFLALSQNCEKRLLPSLCLSVRLPILVEQLCSHWTDFNEILCWNIFRKSVEKIQVSLKCDENNGYLTRRPIYIYIYIYMIITHLLLLRMRNISEKNLYKKSKHILCSITFFFENHVVYGTVWKIL